MKTTITTLTIALGISLGATAQDENTKRSAELQVLDRFVGTWDVEVTAKPPGGGPPSTRLQPARGRNGAPSFTLTIRTVRASRSFRCC